MHRTLYKISLFVLFIQDDGVVHTQDLSAVDTLTVSSGNSRPMNLDTIFTISSERFVSSELSPPIAATHTMESDTMSSQSSLRKRQRRKIVATPFTPSPSTVDNTTSTSSTFPFISSTSPSTSSTSSPPLRASVKGVHRFLQKYKAKRGEKFHDRRDHRHPRNRNLIRFFIEIEIVNVSHPRVHTMFNRGVGFFVTPTAILTAAHIVPSHRLLDTNQLDFRLKKLECGGYLNKTTVIDKAWHNMYNHRPPKSDIALLKTNQSVLMECSKIKIVKFAKRKLLFGHGVIIVGYKSYVYKVTTRRTRTTTTTTTPPSSSSTETSGEFYTTSEEVTERIAKTRIQRTTTHKPRFLFNFTEEYLSMRECPYDRRGGGNEWFCVYPFNKDLPTEWEAGAPVFNLAGNVVALISYQEYRTYAAAVTYCVNINTIAMMKWIYVQLELPLPKKIKTTARVP